MAKRLTVLFIPHPVLAGAGFKPWGDDIIAAIGNRHDLRIFDYDQPVAPQLDGVHVVIDLGGEAGSREGVSSDRQERATQMAEVAQGRVQLWQIVGSGYDHFDLKHWRSKKIPVANTPGPCSAESLANCAMMFLLMLARQYPLAHIKFKQGVLGKPMGRELEGLKLGILGFGASGQELAQRARSFGMKILAIDVREVGKDEVEEFGLEFVGKPSALDQVIAQSDVLSLHLHLNEETHHIIDARRLDLMKPTALLINVARGGLVDEAALVEALLAGRIGGAGLDVFTGDSTGSPDTLPIPRNSPVFDLPNVIATPHIAGYTDGTSRKRAAAAANNVDRVAQGLEPLYQL